MNGAHIYPGCGWGGVGTCRWPLRTLARLQSLVRPILDLGHVSYFWPNVNIAIPTQSIKRLKILFTQQKKIPAMLVVLDYNNAKYSLFSKETD